MSIRIVFFSTYEQPSPKANSPVKNLSSSRMDPELQAIREARLAEIKRQSGQSNRDDQGYVLLSFTKVSNEPCKQSDMR